MSILQLNRVLLGFILPTWFLSMWLSNTATSGMMIPVAEQVIEQMEMNQKKRRPETATSYMQRGVYAMITNRTARGPA
jgi:di/tricarboxylate transporter